MNYDIFLVSFLTTPDQQTFLNKSGIPPWSLSHSIPRISNTTTQCRECEKRQKLLFQQYTCRIQHHVPYSVNHRLSIAWRSKNDILKMIILTGHPHFCHSGMEHFCQLKLQFSLTVSFQPYSWFGRNYC